MMNLLTPSFSSTLFEKSLNTYLIRFIVFFERRTIILRRVTTIEPLSKSLVGVNEDDNLDPPPPPMQEDEEEHNSSDAEDEEVPSPIVEQETPETRAESLRLQGNDAFKAREYAKAVELYSQVYEGGEAFFLWGSKTPGFFLL